MSTIVQRAFEYLVNNNLIDYDQKIKREDFEKALEMPFNEHISYMGPFLNLKMEIENNGFFCTTKDCNKGDLYVFPADFMTKRLKHIEKNTLKKKKRALNSMLNVDFSRLSENTRGIHLHTTHIYTLNIQQTRNLLHDL